MEEGSLRAEANVSVRPMGTEALGVKTEIKNVASFSGVQRAIEFEIRRQVRAIESGEKIVQETRGWDADRGATFSQRTKESAHDYRYFPEPDLVPVVVDEAWQLRIEAGLPELPRPRRQRFEEDYALSAFDAGLLTAEKATADYFEKVVAAGAAAKPAANWIMGDLQALLTEQGLEIGKCLIKPEQLASMIGLIENGTISGKIGKEVLAEMVVSGKEPQAIVSDKGWTQVSDAGALEPIALDIIMAHPGPVADYRAGKEKAMGFLVGQMMRATKGKGNPQLVNKILAELIAKE